MTSADRDLALLKLGRFIVQQLGEAAAIEWADSWMRIYDSLTPAARQVEQWRKLAAQAVYDAIELGKVAA